MAETMDFFEALYSQRALRYLKEDPVPDEMIKKIIDAGIHAPSGGNAQGWAFVVIKDPETKRKMAPLYAGISRPGNHPEALTESQRLSTASSDYLGDHVAEVPVWILACTKHPGDDITHGASIYPAVQNMLLTARVLGLGSVMTTRVRRGYEKEIKEWLGIPDEFVTACMIPLGFLQDGHHYGPTTRRPAWEVTHWDKWGDQQPEG